MEPARGTDPRSMDSRVVLQEGNGLTKTFIPPLLVCDIHPQEDGLLSCSNDLQAYIFLILPF